MSVPAGGVGGDEAPRPRGAPDFARGTLEPGVPAGTGAPAWPFKLNLGDGTNVTMLGPPSGS